MSAEDVREFIRIQNARFERSLRAMWERNDRTFAKIEAGIERSLQSMERLHAKWDAQAEEQRAHAEQQRRDHEAMIEGLYRMMDRLPPPESGPAAA